MKKGMIIFFAVMSVIVFAAGIHCYNSVTAADVIDLQRQGVSYYDALMLQGEAQITSGYLFFISLACAAMSYVTKRVM